MKAETLARLGQIARGEIVPKSRVTGVTGVTRRVVTLRNPRRYTCYTRYTSETRRAAHGARFLPMRKSRRRSSGLDWRRWDDRDEQKRQAHSLGGRG